MHIKWAALTEHAVHSFANADELICVGAVIEPTYFSKDCIMRSLLSAAALSIHIFLATVAVASAHSTAPATNNSDNEANFNDPALTAKQDKEGQVPVSDNEAALILELKKLVSNRLGTIIDRNDENSAVQAFYAGHGFQPIWTTNGALNEFARR